MNVVFPGSFDPLTKGHKNIILKVLNIFDSVDIVILNNFNKSAIFSLTERKNIISSIFKEYNNINVHIHNGLLCDYVKNNNVNILIRGVRNTLDFEVEKINAKVNKELCGVETILFLSDKSDEHISSTIIKDIYFNGGDIDLYVDKIVLDKLCEKFRRNE